MSDRQTCPNCSSENITGAEKAKSDKATHLRMRAYKCKDCNYTWLKVVSMEKNSALH